MADGDGFSYILRCVVLFMCLDTVILLCCFILVLLFEATFLDQNEYIHWYCLRGCSDSVYHDGEIGVDIGLLKNGLYLLTSLCSVVASACLLSNFFWRSGNSGTQFHIKLVASLGVNDIFFSFRFLIISMSALWRSGGLNTPGTLGCYISAWMGELFGPGSLCWNFVLVFNIFFMVSSPNKYTASLGGNLFIHYSLFAWGVPICLTVILFFAGKMGLAADGTCWVTGKWYLLTFVPFVVYFMWTMYTLAYTMRRLGTVLHSSSDARSRSILELISFTLAYFFIGVWPLLLYLHSGTGYSHAYLLLADAISSGSTGAVNSSVWAFLAFRTRARGQENRCTVGGTSTERTTQLSVSRKTHMSTLLDPWDNSGVTYTSLEESL